MEYNIDDWGYTYMYYGKGAKNPCQAEKPMYPFGYGLSYTTFEYEVPVLNMSSISKTSGDAVVSVNVKNTGKRDGAEVVQVYATFGGNSCYGNLNKRLVGFKRVEVKAGETVKAEIPVSYRSLAYFNTEAHNFQVPACTVTLEVAANSADENAKKISLNAQAGVAEDSYISTHIDEFPVVSNSSQLAKTDHVYTVMGAYVCPASEYDKLPKGVYILNGYKYIKK